MKRKFLAFLLLFCLTFTMQACLSSDDSNDDNNNNNDGDTDSNVNPDDDSNNDSPVSPCDSCLTNQYCDANETCQNIVCECCAEDFPCGDNTSCVNGMCVGLCQDDGDCAGGFVCSAGECALAPGKQCQDGYNSCNEDPDDDGEGVDCNPACNAFQFCDLTDASNPTCEDIACECCHESDPCSGTDECVWQNGEYGICTATCTEDTDCGGGFECIGGLCTLMSGKQCPTDTGDNCDAHEPNPAGGPCAFGPMGSATVWPGRSCEAGAECLGITADATDADSKCNTNEDCMEKGYGENGYCDWSVGGYCAMAFCASPCNTDDTCPEGLCKGEIGDGQGGTVCFCSPNYFQCTGDQKPGEVCEFDSGTTTYFENQWCEEGADCLSYREMAELACDDTDASADEDCVSMLGPNSVCLDGYCRLSFCTTRATLDAEDNCDCSAITGPNGESTYDIGYSDTSMPTTCWCAPWPFGTPVGEQGVGEACKYTYDAAYDDMFCNEDGSCIHSTVAETLPCLDDAACIENTNIPGAICFDGTCRGSYCVSECVNDACEEAGQWPITISGSCFCAPYPMADVPDGTKQLGETCQLGMYDANGLWDGEFCADSLICAGKAATETACTADAECVTAYGANSKCNIPDGGTDGFCAYSACVDFCNGLGTCEAGQGHLMGTEACYCLPSDSGLAAPAGTAALGAQCAYGDDTIPACATGMQCAELNLLDDGDYQTCTESTACQGTWPNDGGGANGYCDTDYGMCMVSFCIAPCNDQNACDTGEPMTWLPTELGCWCTTTPYYTDQAVD